MTARTAYDLAGRSLDDLPIDEWVEQFDRDGFVFLTNVLGPDVIQQLRDDLDAVLGDPLQNADGPRLHKCMFETSEANLSLFDLEPVVTFAERLIGEEIHVFHNNSYRTYPGGGISGWHQDDRPHLLVTDGAPPRNIRLPVLFFNASYYLTDVDSVEKGPTQVIPGSQLLGSAPPDARYYSEGDKHNLEGTEYEPMIHSCLGPAGSLVLFNNQVWHRGAPNESDHMRYVTQVGYGRRIIGPMYPPFMNYVMPEHVYKDADERLRRLLGFKTSGAYG